MDAPSDGWNGIFYVDVYERIPVRIAFIEACSEEPSDLLCDRVQVNVIETGSGWQARHGAHLRETTKAEGKYFIGRQRKRK